MSVVVAEQGFADSFRLVVVDCKFVIRSDSIFRQINEIANSVIGRDRKNRDSVGNVETMIVTPENTENENRKQQT